MRRLVSASVAILIGAACAKPTESNPGRIRPRDPPPRVLVVNLGRVSLRSSAWVELHLWRARASEARHENAPIPFALRDDRSTYDALMTQDDEDTWLRSTVRAVGECGDNACAAAALGPAAGSEFGEAMASFVASSWRDRATAAHGATEVIRAAFGPEADALALRIASDLGVTWPDEAVVVDLATEAPAPGKRALGPVVLAARSRCFAGRVLAPSASDREREAEMRRRSARVIDCVLSRALPRVGARGVIHATLARELGEARAERAWELLAIHAVAATVSAWEPSHDSVPRQWAAAVEREILAWLAEEWRGYVDAQHGLVRSGSGATAAASDDDRASFARRYAAAFERLAPITR